MFNVRLAGGHLYGKQLFTWLSLVVSLMASFVLSFFPLDVLDEIWDLIESVSEGFLTYSSFFTSDAVRNYNLWSCQKVCKALIFLLDNVYIRFGSKLYRQIVGLSMGTNYVPLVADLFLFCYKTGFILSLSDANQSEVVEAFSSTSRYLDDLLSIDDNVFDSMVNHIYPSELQLNKAYVSDTEASFLVYIYLHWMVLLRLKWF